MARLRKQEIEQNYPSPRWSGEILDCSMPMTFDTYDHCSYDCMYCFSYYQKALKEVNPLFTKQNEHYRDMKVRAVNVEKIKKLFRGELNSQFNEYIRQRLTMQWGGLSDPFDGFEKKYGITLQLLEFFKEIDYPLCFSTKATWWLYDERYQQLFLEQENWNCKFSIINLDPKLSRLVEKGCPSPENRIAAIRSYTDLGAGGATLRLRPFIIGMSDRNKEHIELIRLAAAAGATAVSVEFFCLEGRANESLLKRYQPISEAIGFDVVQFYKRNSPKQSGYLRLNWKVKEPYMVEMEDTCKELGLRFYVSDAHHKDRCHTGSCCGLPNKWDYQRGQFTQALITAKGRKSGLVYWSKDMEPHLGMFKEFLWRKAENFNTQGTKVRCGRWKQTMYDYIHEMWNSPNNLKSPYKYFQGLLRPVETDENGDIVYKYTPYNEEE